MRLKRLAALALAGMMCITAFTGCGVKSDEAVATLGEEKVTYGVANFLLKYQKASVDDMYALYATYYGVDSLWNVDMYGNGSTAEESFKSTAMELLHEMYTLKAHMDEYDVEITEEEQAKIKAAVDAFMADNSQEALEEFGATEEIVTEVMTLYTIQSKMYDAIAAKADHEVSDEEANMRGYSMITMDLTGTYQDGKKVEYTEDEVAALKSKALEMSLDLKVKTLEEVATLNGYEVTTAAYQSEDSTIDAEVLTALDALKEGEVSGMVETEDAIYFLRIDADTDEKATESNRQTIIAEREFDLYEEVVTKWQENDGWKVINSVLNKIDFHNMFTLKEASTENTEDTQTTESTEDTQTTENTGDTQTDHDTEDQ